MSFFELRRRTLANMTDLLVGKRLSGCQEILDDIALDIRQKHRKRQQRQHDLRSLKATKEVLEKKRQFLQSQVRHP